MDTPSAASSPQPAAPKDKAPALMKPAEAVASELEIIGGRLKGVLDGLRLIQETPRPARDDDDGWLPLVLTDELEAQVTRLAAQTDKLHRALKAERGAR